MYDDIDFRYYCYTFPRITLFYTFVLFLYTYISSVVRDIFIADLARSVFSGGDVSFQPTSGAH